jgi:hypothetical protein
MGKGLDGGGAEGGQRVLWAGDHDRIETVCNYKSVVTYHFYH